MNETPRTWDELIHAVPPIDVEWCDENNVDPSAEIFDDGSYGPSFRMVDDREGWVCALPIDVIGLGARIKRVQPFRSCTCTTASEWCRWCLHIPAAPWHRSSDGVTVT